MRAPRANRVFGTDENRIRTKNTVLDKSNHGVSLLLSKIADCVRTAFGPRAIGDPRGPGRRPRKHEHDSSKYLPLAVCVDKRP
ncbi:MAG TPA: hypothetical protein VIJ43_00070 [Burkholderiales bacterium]